MAIIRIKRTTGSGLPTGLTFGELAFVGASGGATANRLYIAGPEGTCLWIGAQILNSPTFWSGITAETTLPTVSAVEGRITTRLASGIVTSFNSQSGAVQGVSAIGATSGSSWQKLAVSFVNAYSPMGATGYVNILGATWADTTVTTTAVGGIPASSNISNKTVFEILQQMLYVYQSVSGLVIGSIFGLNSIADASNRGLELGQTLVNQSTLVTINASVNNSTNIDASGYGVTYATTNTTAPAGSCGNGFMFPSPGYTSWSTSKGNISVPTNFHATSIGANVRFRASVSQYTAWFNYGSPGNASGATVGSGEFTYQWWARIYWGKTAGDALTASPLTLQLRNSAGNVALGGANSQLIRSSSTLNSSSLSTYGLPFAATPTGEYMYIWIPSTYTINKFTNSEGGAELAIRNAPPPVSSDPDIPTVSITNPYGVSVTYKIYQVNAAQSQGLTVLITQ
jgi:hypothetical protein